MNTNTFNQHIQVMQKRLDALYQGVGPFSAELQPELLPQAFKELGTASEELQIAVEELTIQNEQLLAAQIEVEIERQRYQDLFEFAPDGYLLTDALGTIKEANRAAAKLLNVSQRFLVGKPLIVFIAEAERRLFDGKLKWMQVQRQEVMVTLAPRNQDSFKVGLRVAVVGCREDPKELHISLRFTPNNQTEAASEPRFKSSLEQKHTYLKGELIPISPKTIWQVCQGIVKLTTMSEKGEEVLIGLASSGMPFGSDLTALKIYQAVALSEVKLICFSETEIANQHLAQTLLPKINQRLQQTELLLAISGQRHVKDRFNGLLQLLKQEVGQPVPEGTRLSIRFTHQDLADACSTTRVTITRLLGKLQTQGEIALDAKSHIILLRRE